MDPLRDAGKLLFIVGIVFAAVGGLLLLGVRLPFRLGRLPGDVVYQRPNFSFYFPIATCLLLSAILTAILWAASLFKR